MGKIVKVNTLAQWAVIRPLEHHRMLGYSPRIGKAEIVSDECLLVLASHPEPDWLYRAVTLDGGTMVDIPGDALARLLEPGDTTVNGTEIDIDWALVGDLQNEYEQGRLDLRNQTEVRMNITPNMVLGWALARRKYRDNIYERVAEMMDFDLGDPKAFKNIDEMSEDTIFDLILRYEGIIGYGTKIRGLVEEIYKVSLRRVNY